MATASVIFAKVAPSAVDVITTNFISQNVTSGNATSASTGEYNYCIITPLDGNMYVAFTTDGSVPNPTNDPKIPLVAGAAFAIFVKKGTRIGVIDR